MNGMRNSESGFTYIEVLLASTILAVTLLAVCGMFVAGHSNVASAGKMTVGMSAARQVMEELKRVPFANLDALDDFDTDDPDSQPANDPEREIVRRMRYVLSGEGVGWTFTAEELERWSGLSDHGHKVNAVGTIQVTNESATLKRVTVRIAVPGRWRDIEYSTFMAGS